MSTHLKRKKVHFVFLAITASVFIWSVIKPTSYSDWALEVSPSVISIIIVIIFYNRFRLTTLSYFIISLLTILTFIGGHYTYSEVPLFDWIKDHFHLQRNHYDRFGHFLKGLSVIIIRELLLRLTPLQKNKWLFAISICISLALAALYEIIEWSSTKISKGSKTVKDFLGAQGDIWDAQWDMTFELVGAILAYVLLAKFHNRLLRKLHQGSNKKQP